MYTNMLPATGAGAGLAAGWYYGHGAMALLALGAVLCVVLAVLIVRKAAGR